MINLMSVSQKGVAPLLIVLVITILFGVGGSAYYLSKPTQNKIPISKDINHPLNTAIPSEVLTASNSKMVIPNAITRECTDISNLAIKQKRLDKVSSCLEQKFKIADQPVHYVDITHGDPMDCPSGCIYKHYYGVVENNNVTDFFPLREDLLNTKLFTLNPTCSLKTNYQTKIVKQETNYRWEVIFTKDNNQLCVLEGYIVSSSEGNFDISNLKYTTGKVNCSDPQTAQEMCNKRREVYGGSCYTPEEQKSGCQILVGEIDCNDLNIARQFCIPVKGDKNCNDKQENLNYCLSANRSN